MIYAPRFAIYALLWLVLLLAGCAATQAPREVAIATYPAWLEMKPGYAEACAEAGKCIPMTQADLKQLINIVHQKTKEMCESGRVSW